MRRLRSLLLLLVVALFAAPAAADELAGIYDAQGKFPGGKTYTGAVKIVPYGSANAILWKLDDGQGYEGLAIREGDVLGAAYTPGKVPFGLVVYRIKGGTLEGQWVGKADRKAELGLETLKGPENLSGKYEITLGQNRDGTTNYTGQVLIKPDGDTYLLAWMVPDLAYIGRGIRIGDVLVVAYGTTHDPKQLPGVVAYKVDDANTLSGTWATGGVPATGSETLKRRPN